MPEPSHRLVVLGGSGAKDVEQIFVDLTGRGSLAILVHCPEPEQVARVLRGMGVPLDEVQKSTTKIEAGHVYVISAHDHVEIKDRALVVTPKGPSNNTLDILLRCAADAYGSQSVGVILGGRGASGILGIKRIKEVGGITMAQAGTTGEDVEMPRAAISSGMIDLVLPPREIASRLYGMGQQRAPEDKPNDGAADTLRDILTLVRIRSGHDFASYKRATLFRRISRRMQVCQSATIADYYQYVRDHPGELTNLLRDFLISVTNFFRDQEAFDALGREIIPRLFAGKAPSEQVRVWVPGCASGEEVYSIAIMLNEYAQQHGATQPIQLFATDIDEESLTEARNARYPETIAVDVGPVRLERFFTRENGYFRINKEIRELVLFSPHNLLRDPPFSRLDLVSCRNLLIYLNREAQDRVLNLFHFGLRNDGYLFLGTSESAENTSMFSAIDPKHRLFQRRVVTGTHNLDTVVSTGRWYPPPANVAVPAAPQQGSSPIGELHFRIVEQYAPPSVLVNQDLDIIHVSEHAGKFLNVVGGEPTKQLLRLALPALRLDLRTAIYAARQAGHTSDRRVVRFEEDGQQRAIEIRVVANTLDDVAPGAMLVMFDESPPSADAPPVEHIATTLMEPVVREIEDELHRTRDQLRTTIEQYETSLEELKASNEELQAINEELRSATEELETSKEELQSVNEELTTLNHELKVKVDEVSHANSDLQNLMSSTEIGVVFLDRQLHIKRFTPRAQDLFNVIPTDIGRPLAHLTHRLDAKDLAEQAQTVLQTLRTVEREVASTDGRRYLMRLLPYRSLDDRIDGVVVTFVDVTDLREAVEARRVSEAALAASEERLHHALRIAPIVMLSIGPTGPTWGFASGKEITPDSAMELFAPGHADRLGRITREVGRSKHGQRAELEVTIEGQPRTYDFRIEPTSRGVDVVGFDITPSKLAEASLRESDRRKDEFLATLSHELRNPLTPLKVALDIAKIATDTDKRELSFNIMERQVNQLEHLVDELLDLSRITQGKIELRREQIEASQIIEGALEVARPLISQHKHNLRIVLPEEKHHVVGDLTRLTQVATNLLVNAAKYTPDGGDIELALTAVPARGVIQLHVRDNGVGIPSEILPRVFDIFVQGAAHGVQGGLGIGLNLVRRLVELHGGTVSASSAGKNRGSEFVVELPMRRS